MWSDLFDSVLTLSWQAGIIALVIMALRPLLKRAPRWAVCLLWLLVAVRLVLPASLTPQSAVSLQSEEPLPARAYHEMQQREETYAYTLPEQRTEEMQVYKAETVSTRVLPRLRLIGVGCMLLYMVLSYYRVWLKTLDAPRLFDNVYQCDEYGTPFVLGLFAPRIYVPSTVSKEDLPQVLAHERCHLRRRDHLVKLLAFLLLALHWFNPVLWAAYILLGRDMERACDELALKDADTAQRAAYSRALVSCATTPRATALCPLAFGEVAVKERVKAVLTAKKTARWALVLVGVAAVVICIFLLTKPVDTDTSPEPTPPPIDTNTSLEPTPLPLWMQNNSVVYYDGTLQRTIGQGGDLTEDEIASRQDIQTIGMYDDTILVEPCTKVEYDLHGFLQNVYYLNGFGEYQLAPLSARTTVSLPRWMAPNSIVHVDENMVLSFTQGNFLLPEEIETRKDIQKAGGITAGALACEPNMQAQYGADGQITMLYRKNDDGTYSGIRPENWPVYTAPTAGQ